MILDKEKVCIAIPMHKETVDNLRKLARSDGRSMSNLIRWVLEKYIDINIKKQK